MADPLAHDGNGHAADDDAGGAVRTSMRRRVSRPMSAELFARRHSGATPEQELRPTAVQPQPELGDRGDYPPDLVFIVDHAGQVLYVNRALGALTEDDVIGSEIFDWIFPEQHALVRECLESVRETGTPAGCEIPGIQHYDADAWYECRLTPNLREGRIVSVTIIARDITRHKRAQQRMRTRLVELERAIDDREADLARARAAADDAAAGTDPTEEVLRDRQFRALLDAAGEAIFIADAAAGTVLDANETACRWLRRPREEVLGRNVVDLDLGFPILPPDEMDLQFTETRDTRRPLVLNGGAHRRADGSTFPVEVAVARHLLGEREVVLSVVRDVKARQRIEDDLHEREARYWALFDQASDAVYVTTRAGLIVEANAAAERLFGYARAELEGLDARELIPRPQDIRAWQQEMAASGVVDRLAVEFRRRDGSALPGVLSASRLRDREGHIKGYQCLVQAGAGVPAAAPAAAPAMPAASPAARPAVPAAAAPARPAVLVVDPDAQRRLDVVNVLSGAGYGVLTETDPARAATHFHDAGEGVCAVIVGLDGTGAAGEWALRSIRGLNERVPLVAVVGNGRPEEAADRLDDLTLAALLPAPVHPLALVQAIREATA